VKRTLRMFFIGRNTRFVFSYPSRQQLCNRARQASPRLHKPSSNNPASSHDAITVVTATASIIITVTLATPKHPS